jgi:predicted house-cleaning NTP pyrophosphatase (Maf/HAM1 superfamily)
MTLILDSTSAKKISLLKEPAIQFGVKVIKFEEKILLS